MQVSEQLLFITATDGTRLAATLYLPEGDGPFATLLEALPYRKDDVTASYAESYERYVQEGGFAVLRLDLRGTGNSGGIAEDEYPDIERDDLRVAIQWAASQPWSNGKVGMFGTSYSGFNSLHMAMEGVPELGAVCAMYATDDRYTDDVHYQGGVLRAIDLIDYPLYMIAMNALPPTPSVWAQGNETDWVDEWRRRIDQHEPWLLDWMRHSLPDEYWRRGSVRLDPTDRGYRRVTCPVMIIAGWADGYRNNTFRTIEQMPGYRLIAGPWSHKDPSCALPGPNIDSDLEIMKFFHQHLRGGPRSAQRRAQIFVRRPTPPAPDLEYHDGHWVEADVWPPLQVKETPRRARADNDEVDETDVQGDVGIMAWNSCAGGLPWGQPLDQRPDNAKSITYDWLHVEEIQIFGNSELTMQVRSSAPCGQVSVKLCDVAPDGTSTLITRGMLDLRHRGVWPSDPFGGPEAELQPVVPGEWMDLKLQFEATTWTLVKGHRLRLAIAGGDWPNCWPAAEPYTLGVRRGSVRLVLWGAKEGLPAARDQFVPTERIEPVSHEGVDWRYETDVLGREALVHTRYGGTYAGFHGTVITDVYEGHLGVSTTDLSKAWAKGRTHYTMQFPEGVCTTEANLHVRSDREHFHVDITLTATKDGEPFAERTWTESFPR